MANDNLFSVPAASMTQKKTVWCGVKGRLIHNGDYTLFVCILLTADNEDGPLISRYQRRRV